MANIPFAENYYSFRRYNAVFDNVILTPTPEQGSLAEIESRLVTAHNYFIAQRYQDAIGAYHEAEALIYALIDPQFWFGGILNRGITLSRNVALFNPLLSASLEWMNVLPVQQPLSTVRPRIPVDQNLLNATANIDRTGIICNTLATSNATKALADLRLAKTFTEQGNTGAAAFFTKRAQETDANTANLLKDIVFKDTFLPAPAPAPALAPTTPAGPAVAPGVTPGVPHKVADEQVVHNINPALIDNVATAPVSLVLMRPLLREPGTIGIISSPILPPRPVPLPPAVTVSRTFGTMLNNKLNTFTWQAGDGPPLDQVRANVYNARVQLTNLVDLNAPAIQPSDLALELPHDYYYVIPLCLAECYHALGDYTTAEGLYFQAASYQFLNTAIEAPYVWQRLATLYLDWGNTLFRDGETAAALGRYQQVLNPDSSVPNSQLYIMPALQPGANAARTVIANLQAIIASTIATAAGGAAAAPLPNVNPVASAIIVEVYQQILKINGGLDFWGFWAPSVPIWTFDYLQSVAINFTQLAISAERDFINYQDRADQGALTRQQIVQQVTQTQAEVQAAQLQAAATAQEVQVYSDGVNLANQRARDARANATEYAAKSWDAIGLQAASAQVSGGDDGDVGQLNALASELLTSGFIEGSRGTIAAAGQLAASRLNREYEVDSLRRQANEAGLAAQQSQAELRAAQARAAAANAAVAVASLRANAAQQTLNAFDSQFFTPDVWQRMSEVMWRLYRRYLSMAMRVARTMQQAYNFETDQSLHLIKADYSTDEVKGLLAAEALMADIQSFTYDLITSRAGKPQPLRQTISLANRYPYFFENQFRKTGIMEFETRIDDFDTLYPGTYAGRIEAVEVEVEGIVPVSGISGALTNSGISYYRMPSSFWPANPPTSGLKYRVQSKEALVLSDYLARQDTLLIQNDQRMLRIFEGAGVCSSWRLELPKAINDIDYGALTDVRLTFYYKARFDPTLHDRVLAQLASYPGVNIRQRGIPLRWLYPDAFFHFQDTGELRVTLQAADFRRNETNPTLTNIGLLVATDGSVSAQGLNVSLATPTHAAVIAQTDANGSISSGGASPWTPLATGTALGSYVITLPAANNPTLVHNGQQSLVPIVNLVLLMEYRFTPRA